MQMAYSKNSVFSIGYESGFGIYKRENNGKECRRGNGLCYCTKWCNGKSQSDRKELNSDITEYKSIPLSFFLLYDERKRRVNWQWIE